MVCEAVSCQLSAVSSPARPGRRGVLGHLAASLLLLLVLSGCAHRGPTPPREVSRYREAGIASWYGEPYHGRRTASGAVYDMYGLTAAHRTLPFGTVIRVTRRDTGASVVVPVNDRGPFIEGRIVDLSYGAAQQVDLHRDGVAPVLVEAVAGGEASPPRPADAAPQPVFWVQVGAFSDLDNARRSRRRLEDLDERAVVSEGPRGLLRVRSGPFSDRAEAERALGRVRGGWPEAMVVSGQAE